MRGVRPICVVGSCDYPTSGGWALCAPCAGALARDLAEIPALVADVEATLARQTGLAGRYGPRSACPPLAYDPRASAALGALKAVLVGWVRVLAEEDPGTAWPADTAAACAAWLGIRVGELRVHPAAGDIVGEISAAAGSCWRAIDRAPTLWFAGACACTAAMYVRPEALAVTCRVCGACYPMAGRRRDLLESARDYRLTIPELGRALLIPAATLRSWHHRGRLAPHGEAAGVATYRIGDVLDLLTV